MSILPIFFSAGGVNASVGVLFYGLCCGPADENKGSRPSLVALQTELLLLYLNGVRRSELVAPKGPIVYYVTGGGGAVVSEESGKIKFLPLHNNPK